MKVNPNSIQPSQNYLKEQTIKYILECIKGGNLENLPPSPLVRKDNKGNMVAIDGHNLIAVKEFLGEDIDVHIATSATDGLPATSEKNKARNLELKEKFSGTLSAAQQTASEHILSFKDLVAKYSHLFE